MKTFQKFSEIFYFFFISTPVTNFLFSEHYSAEGNEICRRIYLRLFSVFARLHAFFLQNAAKKSRFFSEQGCFFGSEKTPLRVRGLVNFLKAERRKNTTNCCKYCTFGTFNGFFVRNPQLKKHCNFFYLSILGKCRRRKASQ